MRPVFLIAIVALGGCASEEPAPEGKESMESLLKNAAVKGEDGPVGRQPAPNGKGPKGPKHSGE